MPAGLHVCSKMFLVPDPVGLGLGEVQQFPPKVRNIIPFFLCSLKVLLLLPKATGTNFQDHNHEPTFPIIVPNIYLFIPWP